MHTAVTGGTGFIGRYILRELARDGHQLRAWHRSSSDRYISQYEVATIAKRLSGSSAAIRGRATTPKNQIETGKFRSLGMQFGGEPLLHAYCTRPSSGW